MRTGLLTGLPALWDLPAWWRAVFSRRPHPFLQFIRYGIAGVAAMVANVGVFVLCERFFFPVPPETGAVEIPWTDPLLFIELFREDVRVVAFVKSNAVAFLAANVVAYVLNFLWVFQSGRHSRSVEISLFFTVSLASFVMGTLLAGIAVQQGIHVYLAKSADIVAAVLVNYVCRKFLIFKA